MQSLDPRRVEMSHFLRARRAAVTRSELGLPDLARGRAQGLRREEIAALAGISVTWYTWLEQGRDINASRQVLDAVANVLRLTPAERGFLLTLGGFAPGPAPVVEGAEPMPAHLQRLLDQLAFPAFAVASDWAIAGWNRPYARLYERIETLEPADRNLLWVVFTDPLLRTMLPTWAEDSRHFLAEFRAEAGQQLGSQAHSALIARLAEASDEFREQWAERDIERFASRRRTFLHPTAGVLEFEHHRLVPSDHPDLHIVGYVPVVGSAAEAWTRATGDD